MLEIPHRESELIKQVFTRSWLFLSHLSEIIKFKLVFGGIPHIEKKLTHESLLFIFLIDFEMKSCDIRHKIIDLHDTNQLPKKVRRKRDSQFRATKMHSNAFE